MQLSWTWYNMSPECVKREAEVVVLIHRNDGLWGPNDISNHSVK